MANLSLRVVDWESQISRNTLKFKFLAIKQQILRSFSPNAARILETGTFNHFIRNIRT